MSSTELENPPLIDITALAGSPDHPDFQSVAKQIDTACRDIGFFSVIGHGADMAVLEQLDSTCREFFALPEAEKSLMAMSQGGSAWRGWFPAGGELTSGIPDRKEGIYFGTELSADDPRVIARLPLHGQNLFPRTPPGLRPALLGWLEAMRPVAERLMQAISIGLGFESDFFASRFTTDPTVLFRVFRYPAADPDEPGWGVGEHTDYGLITLLAQDNSGGLQVRTRGGWADIEPVEGAIVCNLGDMLELMTGGHYRSTPHRVVSPLGRDRLSFPYFFDPSFDAVVRSVVEPTTEGVDDRRWDATSPLDYEGTYGEYLTNKVAKVFPELFQGI